MDLVSTVRSVRYSVMSTLATVMLAGSTNATAPKFEYSEMLQNLASSISDQDYAGAGDELLSTMYGSPAALLFYHQNRNDLRFDFRGETNAGITLQYMTARDIDRDGSLGEGDVVTVIYQYEGRWATALIPTHRRHSPDEKAAIAFAYDRIMRLHAI